MSKIKTSGFDSKDPELLDDLELSAVGEEEAPDYGNTDKNEQFSLSKNNMLVLQRLLDSIEENTRRVKDLLLGGKSLEEEARIGISQIDEGDGEEAVGGAKIIEGVFNGENMIGPDGKNYSVPANYASKSKLIEGDILKLTITPNGTFLYKQIGPIERVRVIGELEKTDNGNFVVATENKAYKVLTASVTYFKGQAGDEVVVLVPKEGDSNWAAVENIVKKNGF